MAVNEAKEYNLDIEILLQSIDSIKFKLDNDF